MTIEPVIETGWTATSFRDVITAGRRLLLRPQRGGRVYGYRRYIQPVAPGIMLNEQRWGTRGLWVSYPTRAQAAQAASLD